MTTPAPIIPTITPTPRGMPSITPYVTVQDVGSFLRFLQSTFGARVLERADDDDGLRYVLVQIGNGFLECMEARLDAPASAVSLHVYVDDVDGAERAMGDAGCVRVRGIVDKPYNERACLMRDRWENIWRLATYEGGRDD